MNNTNKADKIQPSRLVCLRITYSTRAPDSRGPPALQGLQGQLLHLQHLFITCRITVNSLKVNNHSGIQLSTDVFHILLRRLPLQKRVTLRKIGSHVVFTDGQSSSFRTVIPQSILCNTHYAILQSINSLEINVRLSQCSRKTILYFWTCHQRTPVSEPSVSLRDSEGIGVSRAKTVVSGVSDKLAVIREVRLGFTVQQFEDNNGQFEDDPLLHWQPVQER